MKHYISILLLLLSFTSRAQEVINWNKLAIKGSLAVGKLKYNKADSATYAKNCAWLEIGGDTTTRGMIIPRVMDVTGISNPVKGLIAYDLTENSIMYYDGTDWAAIGSGGGSVGNAGYGLGKTGSTFYVDTTKIVNINYLEAQDFASETFVTNAIANLATNDTLNQLNYTPAVHACLYGSDEHAINRAIEYAYSNGYSTVDLCNDTFIINNTILLDTGLTLAHLKGITLQNGFIKRADEEVTTVASAIDSGDTYIVVDDIPSAYWQAGARVQLYTNNSGATSVRNRLIDHVSNDTIYLAQTIHNDFSIGASVRRVYSLLSFGMHGADLMTDIVDAGHIRVINGGDTVVVRAAMKHVFVDGNKTNNSGNYGWTANPTAMFLGVDVDHCDFVAIPNENIVGDGNNVTHNNATKLNGSFYHQSNSMASHLSRKFSTVVETNDADSISLQAAKNQHGDAFVVYSFASQNMKIHNNTARNGGLVMNYFETSVDPVYIPASDNTWSHNTFENFGSISTPNPPFILVEGTVVAKGGNIHITGNTFKNCGTNDWSGLNQSKGDSFLNIFLFANSFVNTTLILPKHRIIKSDYNGNFWDENKQDFYFLHGGKTPTDMDTSMLLRSNGRMQRGWYGAASLAANTFRNVDAGITHVLGLLGDRFNKVSIAHYSHNGDTMTYRQTTGIVSNVSYNLVNVDSSIIKNRAGTTLWSMSTNGEFPTARTNIRPMWSNPADYGTGDWNSLINPGFQGVFQIGTGLGLNNPNANGYYVTEVIGGYNNEALIQLHWPMTIGSTVAHPPLLRDRYNATQFTPYYAFLMSNLPIISPQQTVTNANANIGRTSSIVYCVTSSANDTLTLLGSANQVFTNTIWEIKKQSAANSVVLVPSSGTINGNPNYVITDTSCVVRVQYDGTNYKILDNGCGAFSKTGHNHDDRYYTEAEADALLAAKVPTTRTVNGNPLSSDVTITANSLLPSQTGNSGKVLKTDGTNVSWETDNTAGGTTALDDLSDVVITTPNTGQVLTYNGSNWVNDDLPVIDSANFVKYPDTASDKPIATKTWALAQFYTQAEIDDLLDAKVNLSDSNSLWITKFQHDDSMATIRAWAEANFLSSFTELDPVFTAHVVFGIDATDISNWNTAFGWGNHASAGYQPGDGDLTAIAALSPSNDDIIQRKAGAWTNRTMAQLKTDLALVKGDVGLGNVDNTSDATKNSASATLTNKTISYANNTIQGTPFAYTYAISDETTDITTGTAKITFRAPHAMTVTAVRASLSTTSSSGNPVFDINEGGTSILGTKLSIDASEKTSTTAVSVATITDATIADDAEITIDIDTAGTGAKGAKITIIGTR